MNIKQPVGCTAATPYGTVGGARCTDVGEDKSERRTDGTLLISCSQQLLFCGNPSQPDSTQDPQKSRPPERGACMAGESGRKRDLANPASPQPPYACCC